MIKMLVAWMTNYMLNSIYLNLPKLNYLVNSTNLAATLKERGDKINGQNN